jgi:capsular polysaccharide biosynthesis protein
VIDDRGGGGKGFGRRIDASRIAARLALPTVGTVLVVAIVGLLVGGIAALSIRREEPVYQSTQPLLIDQPAALAIAPSGDLVSKLSLLRIKYVAVLQSSDVLKRAATSMGVDVGTIAGTVSATSPPQSLVIQVNARTHDPDLAPRIAAAAAGALRDYLDQEQKDLDVPAASRVTLTPLRDASAAVKVEPSRNRILSTGLTGGLLAAVISYVVLASLPPFWRRRATEPATVPGPSTVP